MKKGLSAVLGAVAALAVVGVFAFRNPPRAESVAEQPVPDPAVPEQVVKPVVDEVAEPLGCMKRPQGAILFPQERCCDSSSYDRLTGSTWLFHDVQHVRDGRGASASDRRVVFAKGPKHGELEVVVDRRSLRIEPGDERPSIDWMADTESAEQFWPQDSAETESSLCRMCGELIECDGKMTTVRFDEAGGYLEFNDPVELGPDSIYYIYRGNEILLEFKDDPTEDGGQVRYTIRNFAQEGAEVTSEVVQFKSEPQEMFAHVTRQGEITRQGPGSPGHAIRVPIADLAWLWLERLDATDWQWGLKGGYRFPLKVRWLDAKLYGLRQARPNADVP